VVGGNGVDEAHRAGDSDGFPGRTASVRGILTTCGPAGAGGALSDRNAEHMRDVGLCQHHQALRPIQVDRYARRAGHQAARGHTL
jgi:hypothetical protein